MLTDAEKRRLTPEDLLVAERDEKRQAEWRQKLEDDYNVFNAADDALERNPDATSVKGRIITNRNTGQRRTDTVKNQSLAGYMLGLTEELTLRQLYDNYQSLIDCFHIAQSSAPAPNDPRVAQTDTHDFDVARVSPETQKILDAEAGAINTQVLALAGIKDPAAREAEEEKIRKLAERYDMIQHPKTNLYVHNIVRVVALEMQHNPAANAHQCTGTVCVFRIKQHSIDSLGIHSKVGDVYNNDTAEVIVTGQHLPPEFKHS